MRPAEVYSEAKRRNFIHRETICATATYDVASGIGYCATFGIEYSVLVEHADRRRELPLALLVFDNLKPASFYDAIEAGKKRYGTGSRKRNQAAAIFAATELAKRPEARLIELQVPSEAKLGARPDALAGLLSALPAYSGEVLRGADGPVTRHKISEFVSRLMLAESQDPAWISGGEARQHPSWQIALARETLHRMSC